MIFLSVFEVEFSVDRNDCSPLSEERDDSQAEDNKKEAHKESAATERKANIIQD